MEELLTLKTYIETGKYSDALLLINELEKIVNKDQIIEKALTLIIDEQ